MVKILFWTGILLILYSYVFYPVILFVMSAVKKALEDSIYMFRKKDRRKSCDTSQVNVAVVISAYNEEKHIVKRVKNLIEEQTYPEDKISLYIGSDGSDDRTVELLQGLTYSNLHIFDYKENRGKVSVLNDLMEEVSEEIVIFSDANTFFHEDNISCLVKYFKDKKVGAVCGELQLQVLENSKNEDGAYWKYERFLKFHESRISALLGANGANYAIRKEYFEPFPADTIIDDFVSVLGISMKGMKVIYAVDSLAYEEMPKTVRDEFRRRVRIGSGNYQVLFRNIKLLNPMYGMISFSFFSHKVLRWLVPHLMLMVLVTNMFIDDSPYLYFLFLQLFFYIISIGDMFFHYNEKMPALARIINMFISMNIALLAGFFRYMSRSTTSSWVRTER